MSWLAQVLPAMANVQMATNYLGLKVDIIGRVVQCKWSPVTIQEITLVTVH